jgi:L,D-peptidoglycan transpeptidase YkuD (ErfK/YbiS/YcfS/YnhG family)
MRLSGPHTAIAVLLCTTTVVVAGCSAGAPVAHGAAVATDSTAPPEPETAITARPQADRPAPAASTMRILPGLGPKTRAAVPDASHQALIVSGEDKDSPRGTATLYDLTADGWQPQGTWPTHNALHGWTDNHHEDDLRSPIGVFTLTDAGGRLPDPGTRLPYHQSASFAISGTGFVGDPLAGSFDYVVAIDYNRRTGTSPLDGSRPLGDAKGGGIWLHVDHGGPTHGCVSLTKDDMRRLLVALDPESHPVIVMGDAKSLSG